MARGLWGAAALMGGLYWASRQPGGLKGTWGRIQGAVGDIKNGADPMDTGRRFIRGETGSSRPAEAVRPGVSELYNP